MLIKHHMSKIWDQDVNSWVAGAVRTHLCLQDQPVATPYQGSVNGGQINKECETLLQRRSIMISISLFVQGSVTFTVQSHTDLGSVPCRTLPGSVILGNEPSLSSLTVTRDIRVCLAASTQGESPRLAEPCVEDPRLLTW